MGRISVTRNALILTMEDLLVTAMMGTSLTGMDSLVQVSESVVTYFSKTIKKTTQEYSVISCCVCMQFRAFFSIFMPQNF